MEHHATDDGARVLPTFRAVVLKTIVTHTVTYFVFGVLALFAFDYAAGPCSRRPICGS